MIIIVIMMTHTTTDAIASAAAGRPMPNQTALHVFSRGLMMALRLTADPAESARTRRMAEKSAYAHARAAGRAALILLAHYDEVA